MKMMKLLGAASVAALIAGAANAQLGLKLQDSSGTPSAPANAITGQYLVAEAIAFPALQTLGNADNIFSLEVVATGSIPDGQNYFLTIEITNGTLAEDLDGTEITDGASVAGGTVNSGGQEGDTFVRYLVRSDAAGDSLLVAAAGPPVVVATDGFAIDLPVQMTSCGDLTFEVTELQTEAGGTPIDGGTAVLTDAMGAPLNAIECEDAFSASLVPDAGFTQLDFGVGFSQFVPAAPTLTATLGDFDLTVEPTVHVDLLNVAASDADFTDITGYAVDINFMDATNIASGAGLNAAGDDLFDTTATAPVGNTISLAVVDAPAANDDAGTFALTLEGGATEAVLAQVVTASNGVLTLNSTVGLQATDPLSSADEEDLIYEGQYFGPFDWVADTGGRVNSIFRVTGLSTTVDTIAQIVVANSNNGLNGVYPFTISASDVDNGEERLVSSTLEGIAGAFGTADISMVFSTTNDLDVDRLLSGPSTATVVPFGDGANQDGSGGANPTIPTNTDNDDRGDF